jgi:tripartite-type tricarboxylate transporter receptor subunit TctC
LRQPSGAVRYLVQRALIWEGAMSWSRRRVLGLTAGAACLPLLARRAAAETYPSRPVHLLIGFPPGGTGDIVGRLMAQWLSERLGQQFVVENRPGAATNLAVEAALKAPADGYTLVQVTISSAINATLAPSPSFNLVRDIAMVAGSTVSPLVLEVHPSLPVNSVPEFIAYAKANPGKISVGSFGTGTISHVTGELLRSRAGIEMLHVPYRGTGPMLTDLLGGQIQAAFDVLAGSIGHIKAGRLRALAVTTARRSEAMPELPTVGEFLPGFEASGWLALGVAKQTPRAIVDVLSRACNASLADPGAKARLGALGSAAMIETPADLDKYLADEIDKWGKVIREARIKPD